MVRDLRAILASLEKRFRAQPDRHQAIENHAAMTGNTTFKRVIQHLQSPPVGLALDRLGEAYQRGFAKKMLFVRFEDFTLDPAKEMKRVYGYLGVPPFAHDFNQVAQATQEDDTVFGVGPLHEIRPKVAPPAIDYREVLGVDAVRQIENACPWYFRLFGYLPDPR